MPIKKNINQFIHWKQIRTPTRRRLDSKEAALTLHAHLSKIHANIPGMRGLQQRHKQDSRQREKLASVN